MLNVAVCGEQPEEPRQSGGRGVPPRQDEADDNVAQKHIGVEVELRR